MRMPATRQALTWVAATVVLSGGLVVRALGILGEGVPRSTPCRLRWRVLIGWVVARSMLESAAQFAPGREAQIVALLLTGIGDLVVIIQQTASQRGQPRRPR